jgi:hypothetical protein
VAVPAESERYRHANVPVFPLARGRASGLAHAYGEPNEETARSFRALLGELKPRIVHLHSYTAEISGLLVDAARDIGAKTVLSFHIPGVSCARGTMLYMGEAPCDGWLEVRRCATCVIAAGGTSRSIARAIAALPQAAAERLRGIARGPLAPLRLPPLIAARIDRFHSVAKIVDRIVAVSAWVADVLRVNGVPENRIVLCRYGAERSAEVGDARGGERPAAAEVFRTACGVEGDRHRHRRDAAGAGRARAVRYPWCAQRGSRA